MSFFPNFSPDGKELKLDQDDVRFKEIASSCPIIQNNSNEKQQLDPSGLQILSPTIKGYQDTMIVISHDKSFIEDICITNESLLT